MSRIEVSECKLHFSVTVGGREMSFVREEDSSRRHSYRSWIDGLWYHIEELSGTQDKVAVPVQNICWFREKGGKKTK